MTPKIRLRNLRKSFGEKLVLDGIDLDIMPGTSMVVIGGSGTGKSVLLKCILGLIEPDAGTIEIDGTDILPLPRREQEAIRSRIGMLFQNGALFDSLPVWENVVFGLLAQHKLRRADGPTRAAEFLAQVGLAASVGRLHPSELSGGMQKRVALARAIAAQPDIMFFDEPTTGLDPIMGAVIDDLLVDLRQASRQHRRGDHPRHGQRPPHRRRRRDDPSRQDHLAGPGPGIDGQRQPDRGPVHPRPARGADPDGTPAIASRSTRLTNDLARRNLPQRIGDGATEDAGMMRPGYLVAIVLGRSAAARGAGASGRRAERQCEAGRRAIHAELLQFAGDKDALRDWAKKHRPARSCRRRRQDHFLYGLPGMVFDASNKDGKFVLVSEDGGSCSAVAETASGPAVIADLEQDLNEAKITFKVTAR